MGITTAFMIPDSVKPKQAETAGGGVAIFLPELSIMLRLGGDISSEVYTHPLLLEYSENKSGNSSLVGKFFRSNRNDKYSKPLDYDKFRVVNSPGDHRIAAVWFDGGKEVFFHDLDSNKMAILSSMDNSIIDIKFLIQEHSDNLNWLLTTNDGQFILKMRVGNETEFPPSLQMHEFNSNKSHERGQILRTTGIIKQGSSIESNNATARGGDNISRGYRCVNGESNSFQHHYWDRSATQDNALPRNSNCVHSLSFKSVACNLFVKLGI